MTAQGDDRRGALPEIGRDAAVRRVGPSADELLGSLRWPMLLRVPAMALRPSRLAAGTLAAVAVNAALTFAALGPAPDQAWQSAGAMAQSAEAAGRAALGTFSPAALADAARLAMQAAVTLALGAPVTAALLAAATTLIWSVGGSIVARSAALEFAGLPRPAAVRAGPALRSAVAAWVGLLLAAGLVLVPLALLAGAGVALAFVVGPGSGGEGPGPLVPTAAFVAAAAHGLTLALAGLAALGLSAWPLAAVIAPAAAACERDDPFDVAQRSLAYVVAKPLRHAAGVLGLLALGLVAGTLAAWLAGLAVTLARWLGASVVEATATSSRLAASWESLLGYLVVGYTLSIAWCGGAALYLLARHRCDGQEPDDIAPDAPPVAAQDGTRAAA